MPERVMDGWTASAVRSAGPDAIVIGSGPNGLVAANLLADTGRRVLVLESQSVAGGGVRTAEVTAPGFRNDLFSAFHPLAAASPVMGRLGLERYGLRWCHAPTVVAHVRPGGRAALLTRDIRETAAGLDSDHPGDGAAWVALMRDFDRLGPALVRALLGPWPPMRASLGLLRAAGPVGVGELVRRLLVPVRSLAEEHFDGEAPGLLLAGLALHADLTPEAAGGGFFGWMLAGLASTVGFPVPEGGAGSLATAMVRRLEARGGRVECNAPVVRVHTSGGRVRAVGLADGRTIVTDGPVLADTDVVALYERLLDEEGRAHLPDRTRDALARFDHGDGTVKVDWALSKPIGWTAAGAHGAGTVHLAHSMNELSGYAASLAGGVMPTDPFLVIGQMTTADPTRSPAGTESAWAYTHVPRPDRPGTWDEATTERFVRLMEDRIEDAAPGFRDLIIARHVLTPETFPRWNANLVGGAISGGTMQLHQQGPYRSPGPFGRPETGIAGLFLASASAHPGGGVHGACGANAARAALMHDRLRRLTGHRTVRRSPGTVSGRGETTGTVDARVSSSSPGRADASRGGPPVPGGSPP